MFRAKELGVFAWFCLCLVHADGSGWPQFLGPHRNGAVAKPDVKLGWPREGPRTVWQRKVGEGFSAPVVAGKQLLIFHRQSDKERLDCLHASTGNPVWSFEYACSYSDTYGRGDGPRATPSVSEEKAYVFGADGMLHCVNMADGKAKWSIDTKQRFGTTRGFFGMASSPLVEGDAVLLNVGGKDGAGIVAFDKNDGKVLWKATDDQASYSSPIAATINGKRLALFLTKRYLVALDPKTGKVLFQFPWQPSVQASVSAATPLAIDDLVFISASYGAGAALLKFRDTRPEKVWSGDDILSCHYATPIHHQGLLVGFDGRQEQGCNLRCVELRTGKILWTLDEFGAGSVTLINDELLILTEKGELIKAPASRDGFKPNARAQILPSNVRAYPAFADGFWYARSHDKLVCLDLRQQP